MSDNVRGSVTVHLVPGGIRVTHADDVIDVSADLVAEIQAGGWNGMLQRVEYDAATLRFTIRALNGWWTYEFGEVTAFGRIARLVDQGPSW